MKSRKITALLMAVCLLGLSVSCAKEESKQEIRVYTSLISTQGTKINDDNEIQNLIAEKIGAKCIETWLSEQDSNDTVLGDMMISGEYPDFLSPDAGNYQKLVKAGALIPIDNYWDSYPNIKNYLNDEEWNKTRSEDGHIYCIPQFSKCYLQDTSTIHNDEAFWVQVKVLEWAGYPKIVTLDDYFNLLEDYMEANPTNEKGLPYIGYEILANDSFFFGLDNPPMFLDGYPNDGCCIVNPDTLEALDYNLSPTAEKWFRKLNEEYHKGMIDPDCFVLSSDEYYNRISSGLVLGTVDQYWNFSRATKDLPSDCTYIPLGCVIEEGIEEHYHARTSFNGSTGIAVSVSCDDPEGALQFINDLLSPEILNLRFWGVEGVDYEVGEDGIFYQTEEEGIQWRNADYAKQHICLYSYFPYYWGMNQDGINAYCSTNQPQEFYKRLNDDVKKCFDAYGAKTYVEMLNDAPENPAWFPMWSYSSTISSDSPAGKVLSQIESAKHQYLPQLVLRDDFDDAWKEYQDVYNTIDTQVYFDELTAGVHQRAGK